MRTAPCNRLVWLLAGFIVGIAVTAVGFMLLQSPTGAPDTIGKEEAQDIVTSYCKYKAGMCAMLAVDIDQKQVDVMQWIGRELGEEVRGYRLFMCKDADGQNMAVVRPIGSDSHEFGEFYYLAPGHLFSGCPVVCDHMQPSLELCLE